MSVNSAFCAVPSGLDLILPLISEQSSQEALSAPTSQLGELRLREATPSAPGLLASFQGADQTLNAGL